MKDVILDYCGGTVAAKLSRSEKILTKDVRLTIREGESLALIGETGAGKTMTALSVMGLLPENVKQNGAKVIFCGRDITAPENARRLLGSEIVYIPQSGADSLNPARTVRGHMYDTEKRLGVRRGDLEKTALEKLRTAGFEHPEDVIGKYPFELSGGMAQRVTIAVSALSEARLIIADEPTNGLDGDGRRSFSEMLENLFPKAGKLIITHDMNVAALCDGAVVLCGGRIAETGMSADVLNTPRHPYTRALIGALVKNGMAETPRLRDNEGECPFYSRCTKASEACRGEIRHNTDGDSEWWCCGG